MFFLDFWQSDQKCISYLIMMCVFYLYQKYTGRISTNRVYFRQQITTNWYFILVIFGTSQIELICENKNYQILQKYANVYGNCNFYEFYYF